jgi:hypothetical protein
MRAERLGRITSDGRRDRFSAGPPDELSAARTRRVAFAGARKQFPAIPIDVAAVRPKSMVMRRVQFLTTMADSARKGPFSARFRPKDATLSVAGVVGSEPTGRRPLMRAASSETPMNDEPKSPAELKEIRLNRKIAQEAEGIKAMAEIAAADIAIRKRTADLRAQRLAREAADRDKPPEPKVKAKSKKKI